MAVVSSFNTKIDCFLLLQTMFPIQMTLSKEYAWERMILYGFSITKTVQQNWLQCSHLLVVFFLLTEVTF